MSANQTTTTNLPLEIGDADILGLLDLFGRQAYEASSETPEVTSILKRCIALMNLDYKTVVINNRKGILCTSYPSHIPIQVYGLDPNNSSTIHEDYYDASELYSLFKEAKGARCRERFVVPVILYKSKYVCRSATLSCGCEIIGRKGVDLLLNVIPGASAERDEPVCKSYCCDNSQHVPNSPGRSDEFEHSREVERNSSIFELHNVVRTADIKLLKKFYIGSIVDLMVENKKAKLGVKVSSSEKVDKENRYLDFNLIALPYPGCEHFSEFRASEFEADGIKFDWDPSVCDAKINVPDVPSLEPLRIKWNEFRDWDLIKMTQNYLKYLLKYLQDNSSGMLVHCISGWDRTPLFISLIRISLWADGVIHQNLNEHQILYFTIAYDWYLFSHKLSQRMANKEAIFFFCFYMLKYVFEDEFSVVGRPKPAKKPEPKIDTEKMDGQDMWMEADFVCCSQDFQNDETNGNPPNSPHDNSSPQARRISPIQRTSPVQVPNTRLKRTESSNTASSIQSNVSTNSWQIITGTGSLAGTDMKLDEFDPPTPPQPNPPCRKDRLNTLRQLFYKYFFNTVGKDITFPRGPFAGAFT